MDREFTWLDDGRRTVLVDVTTGTVGAHT